MKKHSIIETSPNPFKKGGPPSPLDKYKRDGEKSQETSIESKPPKLPEKKK